MNFMDGFGIDFPLSESVHSEKIHDLEGFVLSTFYTPNTHICNNYMKSIDNMYNRFTSMGEWCTIMHSKGDKTFFPAFLPNNQITFEEHPRIFFLPDLMNHSTPKQYFIDLTHTCHYLFSQLEGDDWNTQIIMLPSEEVHKCITRPANPLWKYLV